MARLLVLVCLSCLILPRSSLAEVTAREAQRYGVDIVILKGGIELRGALLQRNQQQLQLAIQRDWLQVRHPELLKQIEQTEEKSQADTLAMLVERTTIWQEQREQDVRLREALRSELMRLTKPVAQKQPGSQFVVTTLPTERVRRVIVAVNPARQLTHVAWQMRLPKVEETTFGTLQAAVEKEAPHWQTEVVDLSERLPLGQPQTEEEWAARQAIYEYEFRQKLDFQGMGNMVVRVGDGVPPPNWNSLLEGIASEAIQGELNGLDLGEVDLKGLGLEGLGRHSPKDREHHAQSLGWQAAAASEAKQLGMNGFRISHISTVESTTPASVSVNFFARMPNDEYRLVWSHVATTDPADVPQADVDQIAQDPQLQPILTFAGALSIKQQAGQALRFGAAIQSSMRQTETHFQEFIQRHTRSLAGPPIMVPKE